MHQGSVSQNENLILYNSLQYKHTNCILTNSRYPTLLSYNCVVSTSHTYFKFVIYTDPFCSCAVLDDAPNAASPEGRNPRVMEPEIPVPGKLPWLQSCPYLGSSW